jgi:UDP-2,3-diacylglucosamine pyrophosphatase LpxH
MAAAFSDVLAGLQASLQARGHRLQATNVSVTFAQPIFEREVVAIPDVHLCAGDGGDIFLENDRSRARKLEAVLEAIREYQLARPTSAYAVQLGDWFDIWRVCGSDPAHMEYGAIQNADVYQRILQLDADLGLLHVVGNHDAGFMHSLPDRRAGQPERFRLGFWLGRNVYALHGHQSDFDPAPGSDFDKMAVYIATVIGSITPLATEIQKYIDRLGEVEGIKRWLGKLLLGIREDPQPPPRTPDNRPLPAALRAGTFVQRDKVDTLIGIVGKVAALPESQQKQKQADVVIVGHSHVPGAAWKDIDGRPVVLVDAGCWVYGQANLLVAAGDTVAVFDVV